MDLLYFILGLAALGASVGVVSAALGVGGGLFMVPAFVLFVDGMDMNTAKGSSLFIILFVAAYNSWRMNRGHTKNPWDTVFLVAIGSVAGGFLGGWITSRMNENAVTWLFIALISFVALRTLFLKARVVDEDQVRQRRGLATATGFAAGAVAGGTGTGGGMILVTMALWLGIASNERVVALSNTVMVATCTAGMLAHALSSQTVEGPWIFGMVNVSLAPLVILGAVGAAPLGRRINQALSVERRRAVMTILLATIAIRLAYRALS